jgi:3'-phosphoadenosine 5'-phosphosulfate sulfotransferase (PAPS reductase)/FAD synthetase
MAHITEVVGSEWSAVATPGQGPVQHAPRRLNHLQAVEAESIHILREAVAEFARPVMLYSIGKDSSS